MSYALGGPLTGLVVTAASPSGDYHAATTDDVILFSGTGDCWVDNGFDPVGRERLVINATSRVIRVASVSNSYVQFVEAGDSLRWIKGPGGWMPQANKAFVSSVTSSGAQLTSNRLYFANLGGSPGTLLLPVDSTWEGYEKVTVYNYGTAAIALTSSGATVATLPGSCAITLVFDGAIWAIISSTIPATLNAPLKVNAVSGGDYTVSPSDLMVIYSGTGDVFLNQTPTGVEQVVINATGRVMRVAIGGSVYYLQIGDSFRAIGTAGGPLAQSNLSSFTQENTPGAQLSSGRTYVANLGSSVATLLLPVDSTWEGHEQVTVYNYGTYGIQLMSGGSVFLLLPPGCGATLLYIGYWVVLSSNFAAASGLTLTTTGNTGPATLSGTTLNVPQYGGVPSVAAVSQVSDYQSYGDSFTGATGATEYAKGFSQRLAAQFRGSFAQLGFGGDEACDLSYRVHGAINLQPSSLPLVTILIGHNDVQYIGNTANGLAKYGAALTAALAHAGLPATCKVYGQAATLNGTFAANTTLPSNADGSAPGGMNSMAVTGTAHGDTVTFTLVTSAANQPVYIAWFASDGDGGSATLSIDGSLVDTLTTQGPGGTIATVNGGTHAAFANRYVVAAAGSHTLVLTISSSTASGNSFTFLWAGTPNPVNVSSTPARVFALDPAYQAGLALKTVTDAYIAVLGPLAAQLAAEQAPITSVGTVSSGVQSITLTLRYPNLTFTVFQGGLVGQYISLDANAAFFTPGTRVTDFAFGSLTGSDLIVGRKGNGIIHRNFPQAGNEAASTSGAAAGFHLYPGAEIVQNTQPGNSFAPKLEPNVIAFTVGDLVENPHPATFGGHAIWGTKTQVSPTDAGYGSVGGAVDVSGTGIGAGFNLLNLRNGSSDSLYNFRGGPLAPPNGVRLEGPMGAVVRSEYGPGPGRSMFEIAHTANSDTAEYSLFNVPGFPAFVSPATNTLRLPYAMSVGTLTVNGVAVTGGGGVTPLTCPGGQFVSSVGSGGTFTCTVPPSSTTSFSSSTAPLTASDTSKLSTHLDLSPYSFTAACDATQLNGTLGGTDDRAAMRLMFAKAQATGATVHIPAGKICRADMPGGVITGFAVSGSVVTLDMANKTVAGDIVTPQGLTSADGIYLNGVPLTVLTASPTAITANFYHANVSHTSDSGYGPSPAFQVNQRNLRVVGDANAAGASGAGVSSQIGGQGSGTMFQFSYDKTAQIRTIARDSSGVVTGTFDPLPGGLTFFSNDDIQVSNSTGGALDGFYGIASIDNVAGTFTLGNGTSPGATATLAGGLLHAPWTNFEADGVQGYEFENISIADYQIASMTGCQIDQFSSCGYQPGSRALVDWRGGSGILRDVDASRWEWAWWGVQADFIKVDGMQVENGHGGLFFGPQSSPNSDVVDYNDYAMERSIEIDGSSAVHVRNSHFRSGTPTLAPFGIVSRFYDPNGYTGYAGNGGSPANGIDLRDVYFEANNPGTCSHVAPAFIDIDANAGAVAATGSVVVENLTIVNPGVGASCNVPYMVRIGPTLNHPETPGNAVAIVNPTSVSSFTAWIKNAGHPTLKMDSLDETVMSIPLYVNTGSGVAVGEYMHTSLVAPTGTSFLSAGWNFAMNGTLSHCDAGSGTSCTWTLKTGSGGGGSSGGGGGSGGAHSGTLVGTPTFSAGKFGMALFPNDSNYVSVPATAMPTSGPATIEFQAINSTTGSVLVAFSIPGVGYIGIMPSGNLRVSLGSDLDSGLNISDGAFHHCAIVFTGSRIATYVDGVAGASEPGSYTPPSGSLFLGRYSGPGLAFPGGLDEVAFWSIAKYTGAFTPPTSAYTGSEAGLVSLYHLDGTAADSGP